MTDRWKYVKLAAKCLFAAPFLGSGVCHFLMTDSFLKVMPPYLPNPRELVLISGAAEVILGVLLLIPKTSKVAAWGLIALLIAVFPANVYMYQHPEIFGIPPTFLLIRLPMQGVLILWAYAYTGGPGRSRSNLDTETLT